MVIYKYLDPKCDLTFRRIFGTEKNKNILIKFLNDILEFVNDDVIQEVDFLNPNLNPETSHDKYSIVDVLCKDSRGDKYIVEMQVARSVGFVKRAQFYAAK